MLKSLPVSKRLFYKLFEAVRRFAWSMALALALMLLVTPDTLSRAEQFDVQLSTVASQQRFDLVGWLTSAFMGKVQYRLHGSLAPLSEGQRVAPIEQYFKLAREEEELRAKLFQRRADSASPEELETLAAQVARKRAEKLALEGQVETLIAERVEHAAQAEGLAYDLPFNPPIILPPVSFKYVAPPLLLVMSPHERIETKKSIHLLPDLTLRQIEQIEAEADRLGVVSLVVPIGGVGTYPTMVIENSSYETTLEIVSHEWTHNYLDLRPLGWHYNDTSQMQSINETTANIVGHELSLRVRGLPPPSYEDAPERPPRAEPNQPAEFDFNREMRQTRLTVDDLLKQGKVKDAEDYMEARRKVFVEHGYAIRKLNQAYFAFYGSYADSGVGGATNPIGGELKRLRAASGSLKAYLDTISQISSIEEYRALLRAKGIPEGKR